MNVLASNDGTRVVNYAQWSSKDDIEATVADPGAQGCARRAAELAQATPHVYSVVSTHHAWPFTAALGCLTSTVLRWPSLPFNPRTP